MRVVSPMIQVKRYPSENYYTIFNPKTGFFARIEDDGFSEPVWSRHGPELIDISITNWCDRGCPACYRNSSPQGAHMLFSDFESIIRQAAQMGVLQVALGGGNPNQHPDFCRILELTRRQYGIVPSYSTNGRGLSPAIIDASAKFCGAVAVSAYDPYEELGSALRALVCGGVRTNVHFVLNAESTPTAVRWLRDPPGFLEGINAVVFLNYKPVGRQHTQAVLARSPDLAEFFSLVEEAKTPFKVGFDSCMVSGLVSHTRIDSTFYDACEAARFSMFVSESMRMYPCSFMEPIVEGIPILATNMLESWCNAPLFAGFRERLLADRCPGCTHKKTCLGGCPVFAEINLCGKR
jgi:radical SAM protein with 4Fe4S-binding SPASM domain